MKFLSALLLTLTFVLTGCSNSTDSEENINTEKYLSIAFAPVNSVVPINQYVIVSFSAVINAATVDTSSMYIADENEAPIISSLTVDKERVSIIPNEFFLPNKPYTVVVTTAVKDLASCWAYSGEYFYLSFHDIVGFGHDSTDTGFTDSCEGYISG